MMRKISLIFCVCFLSISILLSADQAFAANYAPTVGTVTPSSGTSNPNTAVTFTTKYSDSNGWQNLYDLRFLVNNAISGVNCAFVRYDQNANKLYLCKDNDSNEATRWLGGFAPGSANIIENSYAKLDCSKTTVYVDRRVSIDRLRPIIRNPETTLVVNWSVTFKSTFAGTKNTYLSAKDDAGVTSGWVQKGTWTIADTIAPAGTIIVNNGAQYTSSTTVTLKLSATDSGSGVSQMQFSNNNSTWSTAEAYATSKSWTLTSGDGTKTVYVKYKDAAGNWSVSYSDTIILDTVPPVTILTASLPDGISGESYQENLNATDGTLPYTWSIASQSLPGGLNLNSSTGEISGIPTAAGTFSFVVRVTDSRSRTATKALSIKILPAFPPITDEELLDQTEAKAAMYFYNEALSNGFVKDADYKDFSSIAATGFGLASLCVMAERYQTTPNWTVTPEQARARVNQILDNCARYQSLQTTAGNDYGVAGFLYHFIKADGTRQGTCEVSTVDMALFLAGTITAGEYFGGEVKTKADQIHNGMNWAYFLNTSKQQFSHGWFPDSGIMPATWDRPSDETILVSLLAIGSDTYNQDFLKTMYSWPRAVGEYEGIKVVNSYFGSLFTYEFAHCFFDFAKFGFDRPGLVGSSVAPVNWWVNSVNAVYANRQFCMDNTVNFASYGENSWGITICEYPNGQYSDFLGAAPCENDYGAPYHDGTIAPYGAISSMPLMRMSASESLNMNLAFKALRYYYQTYYHHLWGKYGPKDSFNHNKEFSNAYLGIDVGPQVIMIENYRSGLIWNNFMKNEKVAAAAKKVFRSADPHDPSFIFVDVANADDPNEDGSYDHPFNMIQEGIDIASNGNTIMVSEGIYNESLVINKSGIVIKGDNQGSRIAGFDHTVPIITFSNINGAETRVTDFVIWDSNGGYIGINCESTVKVLRVDGNIICNASISLQQDAAVVISNNDMSSSVISGQGNNFVRIEGNKIIGNSYGDGHNGIYLNGGTAIIKNNFVRDSWSGAIRISNNTSVDISGNRIDNNGAWGGTAGISIYNSSANIYNNIFSVNLSFNGGSGGGLSAYSSTISIINNVFYGNDASRGAAFFITDSNLIAKNNIIYNNYISQMGSSAEAVYFGGTGTQDFSYNLLWANQSQSDTTGIAMGTGNLNTDPLFVIPEYPSFHLQPGSPCVNAGDPNTQYNDKDGTRNDMGVYGGPNSL